MFTSSALNHHAHKIVTWVAGLDLLGFFIELVIASIIDSATLFADAADFPEDFLINLLVLTALDWSLVSRHRASFGFAGLILTPTITTFNTAIWKMISGEPPEPLMLSATVTITVVTDLVCTIPLMNLRKADSALIRGAWLATRNDVLANLLILITGVVTIFWFSAWPDIVARLVIGVVNLTTAKEVYEQTRTEDPGLEMDNDDQR